jgi:hypothetical protein
VRLGLALQRIGLIDKVCRMKLYLRIRIFQEPISIQFWTLLVR